MTARSPDPAAAANGAVGLEAVGMTKRFGALITALDDVSIKVAGRHLPRAARRERRRQDHAGQVHHGLLPAGRGHGAASTAREIDDPQSAAMRTRSASAWSTSTSRWCPR